MGSSNKHTCMWSEDLDMISGSNKRARLSHDEFHRISDLPDDMLLHILSFLGTKEAVQTSSLSKRWVNLWASLPRLNFSPHEFGVVDPHRLNIMEKKQLAAKFKEFVETVLYRRETSYLDTFLVRFPQFLDEAKCSDLVKTCVSYAMENKARVFSMDARIPSEELIACLFACGSVEEMCLLTSFWHPNPSITDIIPEVVNLPRVRRLHLKKSKLDKGSISRLLSGCPALEELTLENCFGEFSCILNHKLKYLDLLNCVLKLPHYKESLSIRSRLQGDTVESAICIEPSRVEFIWKTPDASAVDPSSFMQNFFHRLDLDDHLQDLSGVTYLRLHRQDFKMLERELKKLGEFHNLKELFLSGWCMTCNFSPVALFLEKSPNLQKLTLYHCRRHCRGEKMGIHQMVDDSKLVEFARCKNLKVLDIKLWIDLIKAHEVDEASLPYRREFGNVEVVLSQVEKVFYWW